LHHVPDNPSLGTYRIFEKQWKEVILLWFGRGDVEKEKKEEFIKALVEFDSGIKPEVYCYKAYFLAAIGLAEFKECERADKIINQLIQWCCEMLSHTDIFNLSITINNGLIVDNFRDSYTKAVFLDEIISALTETNRTILIDQLTNLLISDNQFLSFHIGYILSKIGRDSDEKAIQILSNFLRDSKNSEFQRKFAAHILMKISPEQSKHTVIEFLFERLQTNPNEWDGEYGKYIKLLGDIGKDNLKVISFLIDLIQNDSNPVTQELAAESLGKIAIGNLDAIKVLIDLVNTTDDNQTRMQAATSLGMIATGYPDVISTIIEMLNNSVDDYIRVSFAASLLQIDPKNSEVITTLIEIASR